MRIFALALAAAVASAQPVRPPASPYSPPDLHAMLGSRPQSLEAATRWFDADQQSLERFHNVPFSPARNAALRRFLQSWQAALAGLAFDNFAQDAKVDYVLFKAKLARELSQLDLARKRVEETSKLLPFAPTIVDLAEKRQRADAIEPAKLASSLTNVNKQVAEVTKWIRDAQRPESLGVPRTTARRAAAQVDELRQTLARWQRFYDGYDPLFRWWVDAPYTQTQKALEAYSTLLRERLAGVKKDDKDTILGDPIGRDALAAELSAELIPYTPEELIAIANREFDWCDREMLKASRELGYGDDWRRALEHVKTLYVEPGKQPALIIEQANEALDFVTRRNLLTVPPFAHDTWRVDMMTPERQRVNPFFTGGETISISFPTDGMSHEQKMMSLRGNNIHFSRATVHHELIPGHRLQAYMRQRYRQYRSTFNTPFWTEGWSLYWELLLWDLNFPQSPENRIGMLFWRMHRCARIVFSLSFHLGEMRARECVDYLVNRVGHEYENAAGEVRRSFETDYGPLYQAAYLLGGLQIRGLRKELVDTHKMTDKQFHDGILQQGPIPIEMIRAAFTGQRLTSAFTTNWKFYGAPAP